MREEKQMHWYLWEAIRDEAFDMNRLGILPRDLYNSFRTLSNAIVRGGVFSLKLRREACRLEEQLKPFEEEWLNRLNKEDLERGDV